MAIYNGTQKIDMSGVDKVYVGTQLVYQKVTKQVVSIAVDRNSWPSNTDDRCFSPISALSYTTYVWYQGIGTTFSFPGTIIATYDDGSTEDVTSQCVFTGYNMSAETGNLGQGVIVSYTYNGNTVQLATYSLLGQTYYYIYVQVKKIADYIVLSGYNTTLYKNDTFAYGGTVTAYYQDGTSAVVTSPLQFTGFDMSTAGTYTVNVNYQTKATCSLNSQTKTTASVDETYQLTVSEYKTLWEGSITRTRDATGTYVITDIVDLSSQGYTGNKTFRITYSMSASGSYTYYAENGTDVSTYHSPLSTTINTSNPDSAATYTVATTRGGSGTTNYYYVLLRWDYASFKFQIYDAKFLIGTPAAGSVASMTVTKIEEYID